MLADFPKVKRGQQVDPSLLNVPQACDWSLGLLGHALHDVDVADGGAPRVHGPKHRPDENHPAQAVRKKETRIEHEVNENCDPEESLSPVFVCDLGHPEQRGAPPNEEHGAHHPDLPAVDTCEVELLYPVVERFRGVGISFPRGYLRIVVAYVCLVAHIGWQLFTVSVEANVLVRLLRKIADLIVEPARTRDSPRDRDVCEHLENTAASRLLKDFVHSFF